MAPAPLILGIGHASRGDDAAGLAAVSLVQEADRGGRVAVRCLSGEGTALMEAWEEADLVIVADAMSSGAPAGTVRRFEAHERALPAARFRGSTHAFGLAEAIELSRALRRLPQRLIIYGIEGRQFHAGSGLSPEAAAGARRVAQAILEELT
jgi:hydrogenase maturation protease